MLGKLRPSLKKLWSSLFGKDRSKTLASVSRYPEQEQEVPESNPSEFKDGDLEFLFHQLLQGVEHGWQGNRIERFFHKLEERITIEQWSKWLERFAQKILSAPASNYQLAHKMIALGEVSASSPWIRPLGDLAYDIGEELLKRSNSNPVLDSSYSVTWPDNQQLKSPEQSEDSSFPQLKSPEQQEELGLSEETVPYQGQETNNLDFVIEKLLEQKETPTHQLDRKLENWFETGLQKAKAGDLEGAIAAWDKVIEYNPQIAQAWHNRGSALAYLDLLEEAIASFDRAIALNGNDYQSWNDRGNALYNLHRWEEALNSWEQTVSIKPNHYQAWYNRGLALEKLNLIPEALESYERALAVEPEFKLAKTRKNKLLAKK